MYRILDDERRREIHTASWVYRLILCTVLAASLSVSEDVSQVQFELQHRLCKRRDTLIVEPEIENAMQTGITSPVIVAIQNGCDQRYRGLAVAGNGGESEYLRCNKGKQRLEKQGTPLMMAFGTQLMYIA